MGGQYGDGIDSHEKIRREKKMSEKLSILELEEGKKRYSLGGNDLYRIISRTLYVLACWGKKDWAESDLSFSVNHKQFTEIKPEPEEVKLYEHFLVVKSCKIKAGYEVLAMATLKQFKDDEYGHFRDCFMCDELPPVMLELNRG